MLGRLMACLAALAMLLGGVARAAVLCVEAPGVVALTDGQGVELIENGRFESIFTVREGALYAAGRRGNYRLYDAAGEALGEIAFDMIADAAEDALVYRSGEHYGAMTAKGEPLLPAAWTQLTPDGEDGWLALAGDILDGQPDALIHIDADGTEKQTGVYCLGRLSSISGGRMPYMDGEGRYGAVDPSGAVAIEPTWLYMSSFTNGLAVVSGPEGMGVIDATGRTVIAPIYPWLERGATMFAARSESAVEIFAPRGGRRVVRLPGKAREMAMVGDCLAVTWQNRVCLYDGGGRLLAQAEPTMVYSAGTRGQFIACNGSWGEKCQWLVNPDGGMASGMFQQLLPLCPERYAFMKLEGEAYYSARLGRGQSRWNYDGCRYGLMDSRGRILLAAKYRQIRALSSDRLLLVGDDRVQVADRNGAVMKTWLMPEDERSSGEAAE